MLLKAIIGPKVPCEMALLDRVSFKAKITSRYTNNFNRDGSINGILIEASLNDIHYNVFDRLKLILAHPLRHEAIKDATTAEVAVQNALSNWSNISTITTSGPPHPLRFSGAKTLLQQRRQDATVARDAQ